MNLSRRAVAAAAAILLLGAAGQWLGEGFEEAWAWLAVVWLLALLFEGQWARAVPLEAQWQLPAAPRLGQPAVLSVALSQAGPRALQLQVFVPAPTRAHAAPSVHDVALGAGATASIQEGFTPTWLGTLEWPPAAARLLGRFGLAWWSRAIAAPAPVCVVPDTLHADERGAPGALQGEAALLRRGAGLELLGLREYRPGDPLRSLAWKASARSARLMVRDTLQEQHLDVAIVIDAGRASAIRAGTLTRLHHYVNIAARFGERCAAAGDRLGLVVIGGAVRQSLGGLSGGAGLRRLRAVLAEVSSEAVEADLMSGALAARRLLRQRGLVVWFGDVDTADATTLATVASLLATQHFALFAQLVDSALVEEAARPATGWLDPYASLAAQQLLQQQARAARRLAALNCDVVSAPVARLERLLVDEYLRLRARRRI